MKALRGAGKDLGDCCSHISDTLGAESGPVLTFDHNDGSLKISKGEDVIAGLIIKTDIYEFVIQSRAVEGFFGGSALYARRLGVNGDGHNRTLFLLGSTLKEWGFISHFCFSLQTICARLRYEQTLYFVVN